MHTISQPSTKACGMLPMQVKGLNAAHAGAGTLL
jgi:hypothetical protein